MCFGEESLIPQGFMKPLLIFNQVCSTTLLSSKQYSKYGTI